MGGKAKQVAVEKRRKPQEKWKTEIGKREARAESWLWLNFLGHKLNILLGFKNTSVMHGVRHEHSIA